MSTPLFTPPLRASGRYIIDAHSQRFKLRATNWYGASDTLFIPSGLDVRHRDAIAAQIRSIGFNAVRLLYSDEMVRDDPVIGAELLAANSDLVGKTALGVFEAVVKALTDQGLAVVVNRCIFMKVSTPTP